MLDGKEEIRLAIFLGSILLVILSSIILFAILYFKIRHSKHIKEKKLLSQQFNETLLQTQLEIQEQTLKTISQEIHDNIGQILSLTKLTLSRMDANKQEDLLTKIEDSKILVSKAIQDLRDLSRSLNTDNIVELGLVKAIEYENDMLKKAGFNTNFIIMGVVTRLESQKELIIFRIVQEMFNNILKHADATHINILINFEDQLIIMIDDNGKGFSHQHLENDSKIKGIGLRNMRSRASLIGGNFTINSNVGEGTQIKIMVPLNESISNLT